MADEVAENRFAHIGVDSNTDGNNTGKNQKVSEIFNYHLLVASHVSFETDENSTQNKTKQKQVLAESIYFRIEYSKLTSRFLTIHIRSSLFAMIYNQPIDFRVSDDRILPNHIL